MGFRFRKSVNLGGGFRTTFSKSGAGFSWGTKGFRVTKKAGGGTRTTISIPGTGVSYSKNSKKYSKNSKKSNSGCLTICIVWPLKLCWWMMIGIFWLMWQMCYWTVKLCFILPIKFIIKLLKNKTSTEINTPQDNSLN